MKTPELPRRWLHATLAATAICYVSGAVLQAQERVSPGHTPPGENAGSPTFIIPAKDFWFPLRHEPLITLDWIRERYRGHEEKAAAHEIDKAVRWLNLAATHARPAVRTLLTKASAELKAESAELSAGKPEEGEKLNLTLAAASHALAAWHLDRARDSTAQVETREAGEDLIMAAGYLKQAAESSHHQLGPDDQQVITGIFNKDNLVGIATATAHNMEAKELEDISRILTIIGGTLKQ